MEMTGSRYQEDSPHIGLAGTMHAEPIPRDFIFALLVALILPLVLGIFAHSVLKWIRTIFFYTIMLFPLLVLYRIVWEWAQNDIPFLNSIVRFLRPVPPGAIYGNDLKRRGVPWVTMGLITLNILIYWTVPWSVKDRLLFFPKGNPDGLDIAVSFFAAAFLHANWSHVGFNMLFLWGFGSSLEPRLGWLRFAAYYLTAIVGSHVLVLVLLWLKAQNLGNPGLISHFHSLGASGAVSGIMGLFVVRCYFARVSMSVPLIMLPLSWPALSVFSFPMRLQAPALVGLFFAVDVAGSVVKFHGEAVRVNYWAHAGGYLTCMVIGLLLGLHREAGEDAAKTKAARFTKSEGRSGDAEVKYHQVLVYTPDDIEALTFLFQRHHARQSSQSGLYFARLLQAATMADVRSAAALCREYIPLYLSHVPAALVARLGLYLFRNGETGPARHLLERAADADGPWQAKAMLVLAQIFISLDNTDSARTILRQVMERFSGTLFDAEARRLLDEE